MADYPLRIGLSATVEVKVENPQGETLRAGKPESTLYSTDVLRYDETPINQLIEQIINDNSR